MHYIPILKGKDAEFRALAELDHGSRLGLTPLIDLLPLDEGSDADEWVSKTAQRLAKAWPISRPIFADAPHLGGARVSTGEPALIHELSALSRANLDVVTAVAMVAAA